MSKFEHCTETLMLYSLVGVWFKVFCAVFDTKSPSITVTIGKIRLWLGNFILSVVLSLLFCSLKSNWNFQNSGFS